MLAHVVAQQHFGAIVTHESSGRFSRFSTPREQTEIGKNLPLNYRLNQAKNTKQNKNLLGEAG
ncbi:MAG: hypothetical protein EAZ14_10980 [Runella slithyformis]|nr:MAG: hypothetical protein EAZ14_10980 [Runella slithyformis]